MAQSASFASQLLAERTFTIDNVDLPTGHGVPSFLCLHASSLAAFCGRHQYKKQAEAFVETVQRDPRLLRRIEEALDAEDLTYKPLLASLDVAPAPDQTPTQVATALLRQQDAAGAKARESLKEATPVTPEDVAALRKKRPRTADVVATARATVAQSHAYQQVVATQILTPATQAAADTAAQKAAASVGEGLDARTKRKLEQETRATWMKDRGTVLERTAEEELVATCPPDCTVKTQACVLLKVLVNESKLRVHIPCRIDCLFLDAESKVDTVYEVKNRRNRFFVPGYDLDQLCLYVVGSRAARGGVLVERCQGQQRCSHTMPLADAEARFTETILPALGAALANFCRAVQSPLETKAHWDMWQSVRATKL